jgi:hypothetical protein
MTPNKEYSNLSHEGEFEENVAIFRATVLPNNSKVSALKSVLDKTALERAYTVFLGL